MQPRPAKESEHPILFFDGVCNLCNRSVQFVLLRDSKGLFRFAPLQSAVAKKMLGNRGVNLQQLESVVLLWQGRVYERSAALIEVLKLLGGGWKLLACVLSLVPRRLRDVLYDFLAGRRYRWFGRKDHCMMPRPEWRERFLE